MPNLWLVFTTGLLAGGVTCMAVQGGLLATSVAQIHNSQFPIFKSKILAIVVFLVSKLVAYTLLGAGLGWVGSRLQLSATVQAALLTGTAVYMLGVAGAMLEVHPLFRYFLISPPRWAGRWMRNQARGGRWFAPAVLGAGTVLIPCGTTQAMMAMAIGTGNWVYGALIMAAFVVGTSPLFLVLGTAMARLGEVFKDKFMKAAAFVVAVMAIWSLNSAAVLAGSPVTAQKVWAAVDCGISYCSSDRTEGKASDRVTIRFTRSGYKVDRGVVKAGSNVTLNLVNVDGSGCIQAFVMPQAGVQTIVPMGQSKILAIKVPEKAGDLDFSCSMGMYTGSLKVVI